eukprot:Hpha_TRINITY_DN1230_c0_g1::TRINITY_DN1230_c0_g1_i1::g.44755::m.44755/K13298/PDE11; dual 3',5'-cyclic-AMP and -GMP phosphodiesterase 11
MGSGLSSRSDGPQRQSPTKRRPHSPAERGEKSKEGLLLPHYLNSPSDNVLGPRAATNRLIPLLRRAVRLVKQGASLFQEDGSDSVETLVGALGAEWVLQQAAGQLDPEMPHHRKVVYQMANACKAAEHQKSLEALAGTSPVKANPPAPVPGQKGKKGTKGKSKKYAKSKRLSLDNKAFGIMPNPLSLSPRALRSPRAFRTDSAVSLRNRTTPGRTPVPDPSSFASAPDFVAPIFTGSLADNAPHRGHRRSVRSGTSDSSVRLLRRGRSQAKDEPTSATGIRPEVQAAAWKLMTSVCKSPLLARELEKKAFMLDCTLRLANRLASVSVDFTKAADIIAEEARDVWGCTDCMVYVVHGGELVRLQDKPLAELKGVRPPNRGITGQSLEKGETILVDEPMLDPSFDQDVDILDGADPPSSLLVMVAEREDASMDGGRMSLAITLSNIDESLVAGGDTSVCEAFVSFAAIVLQQAMWTDRLRDESDMFERIVRVCPRTVQSVDEKTLVLTIMKEAQCLLKADRCSLFVVDPEEGKTMQGYFGTSAPVILPVQGIAGEVITHGSVLNIPDAYGDHRFNREVDRQTQYRTRSILCAPLSFEGTTLAAVQLLNKQTSPGYFTERDERAFDLFASFAGIALRNVRQASRLERAEAEWRRLLIAFQNISEIDITQSDQILQAVVENAQQITNADRCAFFRVDFEHNCLVAKTDDNKEPIRITMGAGIAGQCYQLAAPINVPDAYQDTRFNQAIDKKTGYHTKSILAIPISCDSTTLAVAQLINKRNHDGVAVQFDTSDVEILELFARFAGQMMRNADVHQHARTAGDEAALLGESVRLRALDIPDTRLLSTSILSGSEVAELPFDWDPPRKLVNQLLEANFPMLDFMTPDTDMKRGRLIVEGFTVLGLVGKGASLGVSNSRLQRCLMAVKPFFRDLPYHNFAKAFDVFQAMAFIVHKVKRTGVFTPDQNFALVTAAIFMQADHKGINKSLHYRCEGLFAPLLAVKGAAASALAIHHANVAAEVLKDQKNNLFAGWPPDKRSSSFQLMFDAILATDASRQADLQKQFRQELIADGKSSYDQSKPGHRQLLALGLLNCAAMFSFIRPFAVAKEWALRWAEEYFGASPPIINEAESAISPRARDWIEPEKWKSMEHNQKLRLLAPAVIEHLTERVRPVYEMVSTVIPDMDFTMRNLEVALMQWRSCLKAT